MTKTRALTALAAAALALTAGMSCSPPARLNVVLVTFDTTRADRIGDYGAGNHTPHLDALAKEGVRFAHAYAPVPLTAPSHSTILTGLYPIAHGVRDNGLFVLGDEQETLAETLRDRGYATAAAIGSFPLISRFGFAQGFDLFDEDITAPLENFLGHEVGRKEGLFFDDRPAGQVNAALLPWLREHADEPFFLWAHYFDPHHPHRPRAPYDEQFVDDSYRAEIAYADESLGRLIAELRALGVWDETIFVFTSDHGEGLGEHREITHAMLLYDSTLHVPLILRVPGVAGGRVIESRVGTVDLVPTLLELLGIESDREFHGRSLAPTLSTGDEPEPRPLYAETLSPRLSHDWGELRALVADDHKYVFGPRPELFDLGEDPDELVDLVAERPERAERMQRQLAAFLRENAVAGLAGPSEMDDDTRERLLALGYLSGSSAEERRIEDRLDPSGPAPQDRVVDVNRMSEAKDLLYRGRPLEAKPLIEKLLADSPGSPYYQELLATAELALGNLDEGLRLIRELREKTTNNRALSRQALNAARTILAGGSDADIVRQFAAESLALFPSAEAQHVHARALHRLGLRDEYLDELRATLELDPEWVAARVDLGVELRLRGQLVAAEEELRRAIEDHPFYAHGFLHYGHLTFESGRSWEAINNYRRAVALEPYLLAARQALISALARTGRFDEARESLGELRRIAPEAVETRRAVAIVEGLPT